MKVLINPLEITNVASKKVSCDGVKDHKNASEGHPLVYLNMGKNDFVICPYCSRYFSYKKSSSKNLNQNQHD